MFAFTYTAALLAITFAVSAAFLFYRYRTNTVACALVLELFAGAFWVGSNAGADVAYTNGMNIFWSGLAFIGGSLILSCFLIFIDVFIDRTWPSRRRLALYLLPTVLPGLFAFSKYSIVETIFPPNAPSAVIPGPLYYEYLAFFFVSIAYGLIRLISHYRRSIGVIRYQTLYVALGFTGFFLGLITFNVLLPLTGEVRFFNVGPQFAAIFFVASTYAVFKHQLVDIRLLIRRGMVYSILLACAITAYAALLLVVMHLTHLDDAFAAHISASIVLLIGIYTGPSLERIFRRATDSLFFKDVYEYPTALKELSDVLNTTLLLQPLVHRALRALVRILRIEGASLELTRNGVIFQEVADGCSADVPIEALVPVRLDTEAIGMLHLGVKRSGDAYSAEDVQLAHTFASQAAIAIKKAELYEELKTYSIGLEQKVQERTAHLEDMQKNQRRMIDDISHELQNPLAVIKTTAEFLMRSATAGLQNHYAVIEHNVDNLSRLVANLLRLARMETEDELVTFTRFDLSALTQEVVEYSTVLCKERGIDLITTIEPDICIVGQRDLIEELVTNLLSNAMKYTHDVSTRQIAVTLKTVQTFAELTVHDTGVGIAPEDLPHIFERFYRGKTAGRVGKGTGLGLAISRKIALQHGGELRAESAGVDRGSTFTLALPLRCNKESRGNLLQK